MLLSNRLLHQINLVLQYNNMLQFHNLNRGQVFTRLWLRTGLIPRNQEQGGIHNRRPVQHGRHEDIVAGTIDKGNVSEQGHFPAAIAAFTGRIGFFVGGEGFVAAWTRTCRVIAFVDLPQEVR